MKKIRTLGILVVFPATFGLASCQLSNSLKETPVIGLIAQQANVVVGKKENNETSTLFAPKNFRKLQYRLSGGGELTTFDDALESYNSAEHAERSRYIRHCAGRIDTNYYEWLGGYITGRASLTTGLDIFSKLLSTAGAVFTPASTVRALSGSSAFIQSANSSIETNFFLSLTVMKQIPIMDNARTKARGNLETLIGKSDFNVYMAADELDKLYMAGTQFAVMAEPAPAPTSKKTE
jgi:hypothetical protein